MRSPRRVADPFTALVAAHAGLVRRAVRRVGVPDRDLPDVVQRVFVKLHEAIGRGLDLSTPLVGWLLRTTYTLVRDDRRIARNARELVTAAGDVDAPDTAPNAEERMQVIDVHAIVDSVLDELSPEHRMVLVMSDMDDMPMSEIAELLVIPVGTGYSRLHAARLAFKRALTERQASGDAAMLPFALWGAGDLLAAEHSIPQVPAVAMDDLWRRLADALGPGALGAGIVGGGAGAGGAAAASAAKVGAVGAAKAGMVVSSTQLVSGVAAAMIVGASIGAALYAALDEPAASKPPAIIASRDRVVAAGATESAMAPAPVAVAPAVPAAPASAETKPAPAAPGGEASERTLLENARLALERGDAPRAAALLARVRSPRYAEERDELQRLLRTVQDGGR